MARSKPGRNATQVKITRIRKRTGEVLAFNKEKITNAIFKAAQSIGGKDKKEAAHVAAKVVQYLNSDFGASRIPTVEETQDRVEKALIEMGHASTAKAYILYRHRKNVEREAKRMLGVKDDLKLSLNAIQVLEKRYFLRDESGKVTETPAQLFRRVARHIASAEKKFGASVKQAKFAEAAFYDMMASLEFLPNSPTLMNAGTRLGQLAACFILPVPDDMRGIFESIKNTAIIHQTGGGTGFCFSYLRPKGDIVKSTNGIASGPVSFMTAFDKATEVVKQGGCISVNSLIRTDKGVLPLGELINCPPFGDNPINCQVYTNGEFHQASLASDNGSTEVYHIKSAIGTEIKATYNHLLGVIGNDGNFSWKKASEIKKGDWLIHVLGGHAGTDMPLPKLGSRQHFNANVLKIPEKINPELAELLGIYVSDGCISTGGRIIFAVEENDKELMEKIKTTMKNQFGLELGLVQKKENDKSVCLIFYSHDLCGYFKKVGWYKDGAHKASVPSSIFKSSKESAYAFLRGLFEGDGDIHADGYPRLYSVSEELMKKSQQLLFGLGIVSSIRRYDKTTDSCGKSPIYHLMVIQDRSIDEFTKNIGFISPRKQNKLASRRKQKTYESYDIMPNQAHLLRKLYCRPGRGSAKGRAKRGANRLLYRSIQHYINNLKDSSRRNLTRKKLRELLTNFEALRCEQLLKVSNEEYFYSKVSGIYLGREYTAEIEVPSAEQFVANSILVHNKRRGANMAVLHAWHPDIEEFIKAKQTLGVLENFNVSVAADERFMHAVEKNGSYNLINPRTKKAVRTVKARSLFKLICESAWVSAEPGMLFIDRMNRANPTPKYKINATNPCAEVDMPDYESCTLGSINVAKFSEFDWSTRDWKKKINWVRLREVIRLSVQFLDNVVELNRYPLPQIREMTLKHRRIGLGVMGFAKMLYRIGIRYDSKEGYGVAEHLMRFITKEARKMSVELGRARGSFPGFKYSKWRGKYNAMRNATVTSIAPTGTISMIADSSSGIEPVFALSYLKQVPAGEFYYTEDTFEHVLKVRRVFSTELMEEVTETGSIQHTKKIPKDIREVFAVAYDIPPEAHVKMQAAFQKHVDLGVSKTINLPANAGLGEVERAYMLAWKLGCKGITIYRDTSRREQVLYAGKKQ